jgi:hypothetical protein
MPETTKHQLSALQLEDLASGFPNIPAVCGGSLAQAAALCMEGERHSAGVRLAVEGTFQGVFSVNWSMDVTDAMRRFWADPDHTTEQGAYAIAILLMRAVAGYTVVERACRPTGIDWWLGPADNLFQATARLEVSGIRQGSRGAINSRVKAKARQTERSVASGRVAFVVVVEFGAPRARVIRL